MAISIDVNLPRAHPAQFPDRCVVCGREQPESHTRVITGTLGWWTWLVWAYGRPFVVRAPACKGCGWSMLTRRLVGWVLTIGIVVGKLSFVWPLLEDLVPPPFRKWAMMGLSIVSLLPLLLAQIFFAMPFDVTAYSDNVDYEFSSRDYAMEFAVANRDADWVKIDGFPMPLVLLDACNDAFEDGG